MCKRDIKLVVSDLDSTFITENKIIDMEAISVLNQLKEKGIRFTFISGRPPYAIKSIAEQVPLTAPVVGCNGAMIVDENNGDLINGTHFSVKGILHIIKEAVNNKLTVLALADDVEYALGETKWTETRKKRGRDIPIITADELADKNVYKVNIIAGDDPVDFNQLVSSIQNQRENYSIALYDNRGCEIVAKGVTKETGLLDLCELVGVDIDDVLAIGDDVNDIEMLREAGVGVAVGNAKEPVKMIADYTCSKMYIEGVIEAIKKFAL